ncbi:MAG TPA: VCBS repeat-containing protein, partial [Gemmataceae bacterium]|nr:VCBS repeat-containing protein [Gemmataceae bacterium]
MSLWKTLSGNERRSKFPYYRPLVKVLEDRLLLSFIAGLSFDAGFDSDSVVVGEFNRDGIPDLAVTNYGIDTVSVLLGNGNGTFQAPRNFAAGVHPISVAVGDFNGDGIPDLAVANGGSNNVSVLLGNG